MRTALNGIFAAAALPISTTGTLASSMPSVVPSTTAASDENRAASTTVATCVLSPISARKNATTVTPKTPHRVIVGDASASSVSARSAHRATAKNDSATSHVSTFDRHERAQQVADEARERMVGERRDQDAGDDRHGPAVPRGEHQRQQLRLVADFAERYHPGRHEKCFHGTRA